MRFLVTFERNWLLLTQQSCSNVAIRPRLSLREQQTSTVFPKLQLIWGEPRRRRSARARICSRSASPSECLWLSSGQTWRGWSWASAELKRVSRWGRRRRKEVKTLLSGRWRAPSQRHRTVATLNIALEVGLGRAEWRLEACKATL